MRKFPLITIAAAMLLAGATDAKQSNQQIVVTGKQVTPLQWSSTVTRELNRNLRYPRPINGRMADTGLVKVKFECSEAGLPDAVALSRPSGVRSLDKAALRAVSGIKSLHPMPDAFRPDQRFEAHIFFASSEADLERQIARNRREDAARSRTASRDNGRVLVLNSGLLAPDRVG